MPVTLDMNSLRQAIERRDANMLISLYADDAQLQVIDHRHPPSSPLILRGKQAISDFLTDLCSRDVTHHVIDEVIGRDRLSFNEACQYPTGEKVLSASVLDLQNGQIVRQTMIQAWDESKEG
ncbi:MAG TPA: nuclear transport factor 2 family protein [Ktedonosporobacter sp.]|jgi:hypothetical protein|nr:nuclear transport factor 2 family protein [Ktedonosporobacter sp.]